METLNKLKVPFRFISGRADTVEQDSTEEISQCVSAILSTEVGSRHEKFNFGIPDLTFTTDIDDSVIYEAIRFWEPRAEFHLSDEEIEDLTYRIRISLKEKQ